MKLLNFCQKTIEYSFYLLFFLVPLAFTSDTSELFEFNKLWLTFILTIVIGTAWFTKMVIKKEFRIQKTPLDIPIALFLVSQIISSFISLDMHTSLWGYYSRFNGGLFSIFSYVFLYYAFVTNLRNEENDGNDKKQFDVKRIYLFLGAIVLFFGGTLIASLIKTENAAGIPFQLFATLITAVLSLAVFMKAAPTGILKRSLYTIFSSAVLVVLWGLPSHFGYDPTCLLFRGTFDVSCWTNDFQPRVRIFSTLGQPAWFAAYLVALLPILTALFVNFIKGKSLKNIKSLNFLFSVGFALLFVFFYVSLLYTQARAAILAFWLILPLLLILYFWYFVRPNFDRKKLHLDFKALVFILVLTLGITFFAGQPFGQLNKFTLNGLKEVFSKPAQNKTPAKSAETTPAAPTIELGGTDSGTIRLLVWRGALDIWKNNLVFGSGLETYAFAYYQYRPAAHNLTSEAKYLYNKAHNEYLNYLATTGTVGIVTYLSMIGGFLFVSLKEFYKKRKKLSQNDFLVLGIIAGYGGILFTNFFGFSVVMINILFYLMPAFVFMLLGLINYDKAYKLSFSKNEVYNISAGQKIWAGFVLLVGLYLLFNLVTYWNADRKYYFGMNYDRAGDYQTAYNFLKEAVDMRPGEPVFKDEFAYNNAVLGSAILAQSQQQKENQEQNLQISKQLIDAAIKQTSEVTAKHPNNIVFIKTKVRVYYTLGQIDPTYLPQALEAIKATAKLAPTDADVSYNLGVLYGQTGDAKMAVKTLENTIKLKPDDSKAYYALGIFYHQLAVDSNGKVVDAEYNKKAIDIIKTMIKNFGPSQQASDALKAWGGETK